jgi:hypothetical protein
MGSKQGVEMANTSEVTKDAEDGITAMSLLMAITLMTVRLEALEKLIIDLRLRVIDLEEAESRLIWDNATHERTGMTKTQTKEDADRSSKIIAIGDDIIAYIERECGKSNDDKIMALQGLVFAMTDLIYRTTSDNERALWLVGMVVTTLSLNVSANVGTHTTVLMDSSVN